MKTLDKQELTLAYEEGGTGGPPLLLVHGISCDHATFAPQFTHFRRARRVVNMDLRGHGASGVPGSGYAPADFAEDLAFLSRELGLHKPVVVGHSIGGLAALALAAKYPDLTSAIVMLDTAVFLPSQAAAEFGPIFQTIIAPGGMDAWKGLLRAGLGSAADSDLEARIFRVVDRTPHALISQAIAGLLAFDAAGAAAAVRVPILHVRSFVPLDEAAFRRASPQVNAQEIKDAGHFLTLAAPERVNAVIDLFLDQL
jgi:pimeloyl-ACP methyl ester carboxylesterase